MAERDGVSMLRKSFDAPEKPEFPSAVGGYSRHEVNKYIEELLAANKSMKRVFYEKTQELRDELQLLSEENRNLKAEKDVIATLAEQNEEASGDKPSTRKIVEQVAGILKARHEAALFDRDEKMRALASALDMSELDAREAHRESEARAKALSLSSDRISDLEALLSDETARRERLEAQLEAEGNANETDALALADEHKRELEALREELEGRLSALVLTLSETEASLASSEEARREAENAVGGKAEAEAVAEAVALLTRELDALRERLEANEAELNEARAERERALAELAQAKASLESAIAERDQATDAAASLTARLDSLKSHGAAGGGAAGGGAAGGDISTELEKRDDEIASLADMLAQRDVRIRRAELELERVTSQLREREAEIERNRRTLTEIARLKERMARLDTPETPAQPLIVLKPSEHEMRKGG